MIVFSYIQQFQRTQVKNFCRSFMGLKMRSSNNPIQSDIANLLTLDSVKSLPTSCLTEPLVLDQPAAKQNFLWDKSTPSGIQQVNVLFYNLVTEERFCDKPNISTLSKTLEARKIHASTNGVSTIATPKLRCGLDQMN